MTLNKIYQQLGWNVKYEDEVKKFNNRILITVDNFHSKFYEDGDYKYIYPNLIKEFAFLSNYPNAKQLFGNSLKHYLTKHYYDAITNAYSSLESLVKTYLNRDKQLDTDEVRNNLVKNLGLEDDWKQLLHYYCKLAHEFSTRHGKKETGEKSDLPLELTEFYIYITGTFLRLIIQKINSKSINT